MTQRGCVYIRKMDLGDGRPARYDAHWETDEDGIAGQRKWFNVDDAIAWGRERSKIVLSYLSDDEDRIFSAGEVHRMSDGEGGFDEWPERPPKS